MSELEPISDELKRKLDAAKWPEAPAGLADKLLPGLQAAWSASTVSAVAAAPPVSAVKRLLGSAGALTTAGALILGVAGGVVLREVLAPAPAPQIIVVQLPVPVPPAPVVVEPPAPEPAPAPPPVRTPPPAQKNTVAPSSMAAEQQLLDGVRTALLRGEPQLALPLIAQYRREHPKGALVEEHAALEVQALALAGKRDEAITAAEKFRAKYPGSFFGEAVDLAISELKPPP